MQSGTADRIADKIDIGGIFFKIVVVRRGQKLDGSAGAQIRATDADNDKHVGIRNNLLSGSLDSSKLFFIIINGQINPAYVIVAKACAAVQLVMSKLYLAGNTG